MVREQATEENQNHNIINLPQFDQPDGDDADEVLQNEAEKMLRSWNRDSLLKEANEETKEILEEADKQVVDYYDGEKSFDDMMSEMRDLHDQKVFIKVLEVNPTGKPVKISNTILFDRVGYLEYNDIPFESSIYDGKPSILNLDQGPLIPGMLMALTELREGERANIIIHPKFAYGRLGSPPVIPQDAHLFYTVKIHKVWDGSDLAIIEEYERNLKIFLPLEEKIVHLRKQKDAAKQFFDSDLPKEALVRYKAAIMFLEGEDEDVVMQSKELMQLRSVLYTNIAIILNKLKNHKSASNAAKKALLSDRTNLKAYYQVAKARIELGDYSGALAYIDRGLVLAPNNRELMELKAVLDNKSHDEKKRRDEIMKRMASGIL